MGSERGWNEGTVGGGRPQRAISVESAGDVLWTVDHSRVVHVPKEKRHVAEDRKSLWDPVKMSSERSLWDEVRSVHLRRTPTP